MPNQQHGARNLVVLNGILHDIVEDAEAVGRSRGFCYRRGLGNSKTAKQKYKCQEDRGVASDTRICTGGVDTLTLHNSSDPAQGTRVTGCPSSHTVVGKRTLQTSRAGSGSQ